MLTSEVLQCSFSNWYKLLGDCSIERFVKIFSKYLLFSNFIIVFFLQWYHSNRWEIYRISTLRWNHSTRIVCCFLFYVWRFFDRKFFLFQFWFLFWCFFFIDVILNKSITIPSPTIAATMRNNSFRKS